MSLLQTATDCDLETIEDTRDGVSLYHDEEPDSQLCRAKSILPGHNRYLIYRMIGRTVSFENASRKAKKVQTGVVQEICRNIFSHEVEMTMRGGRLFRFKEPTAIVSPSGHEIVFVYGCLTQIDTSDKALFGSMNHYDGKTMADLLRDMAPVITRFTRFSLGERVPERGRFSRSCRN